MFQLFQQLHHSRHSWRLQRGCCWVELQYSPSLLLLPLNILQSLGSQGRQLQWQRSKPIWKTELFSAHRAPTLSHGRSRPTPVSMQREAASLVVARGLAGLSEASHHNLSPRDRTASKSASRMSNESSNNADWVPLVHLGGKCCVRPVLSASLYENTTFSVEHSCFAFYILFHFLLAKFQYSCFAHVNTHQKQSLSWL